MPPSVMTFNEKTLNQSLNMIFFCFVDVIMIYRLEIENFHSIRDRQVLDLRAPANAPSDSNRLAPCWPGSPERAPKVVAVFGANGSGKSNLLRTLSLGAWFVRSSFTLAPRDWIPLQPFNDEISFHQPTRLKIWWSGPADISATDPEESAACPYCYELVIANRQDRNVAREAVFFWPASSGRKTRLVERLGDGSVKAAKAFGLSGYKGALEKVLRPNASVISTLTQLNHPVASMIAASARAVQANVFEGKVELADDVVLREYVRRPEMVEEFNREISRVDVGVRALEVAPGEDGPEARFRHEGLADSMPAVFESHGTRQFLKLYPLIFDSLAMGGVAVIDELDAAMHSMILPEIIGWFHDPERNPRNAQLWMSCQNTSVLEELSKDEIVFCEKDRQGRTETYSLNDVKAVRRDENFYKKYLGGVYGAVPRIG